MGACPSRYLKSESLCPPHWWLGGCGLPLPTSQIPVSVLSLHRHSMTTLHGPVSDITTTSNIAYELVKHRAGPQGRRGKGELEPVEYEEVVSSPPSLSSVAVGAGGYEVPTVPSPHKHTPLPAQPLASNGGRGGGKGGGEEEEGVYEVLPGEQ